MTFYKPPHFLVEDEGTLLALMREHPLATVLSVAGGEPVFSHLPLEVEQGNERLRLLGHVARANPHWKLWSDGAAVTAIFRGPDAYVSPQWYSTREAVPTWNYVVVHAHGGITVTHDSDDKERILKALIDRHDPAYHAQWDELSREYREQMKRGIVGVTIAVARLEGKFKLSQNRTAGDRRRVLEGLDDACTPARSVAEWMRRLRIGEED